MPDAPLEERDISNADVKDLLKSSYKKDIQNVGNYKIDPELSGRRVKVYHNPETNQTITTHRGTQGFQDILTDAALFFGNKNNKRFKHAEKIQKQAEEKYGTDNLTTLGHSLSGSIASKVGKNSKKIITVNGAVPITDLNKKTPKNQTDIRTSRDLVSILRPLKKGKKPTTIKSKTFNLLKEHGLNFLK